MATNYTYTEVAVAKDYMGSKLSTHEVTELLQGIDAMSVSDIVKLLIKGLCSDRLSVKRYCQFRWLRDYYRVISGRRFPLIDFHPGGAKEETLEIAEKLLKHRERAVYMFGLHIFLREIVFLPEEASRGELKRVLLSSRYPVETMRRAFELAEK